MGQMRINVPSRPLDPVDRFSFRIAETIIYVHRWWRLSYQGDELHRSGVWWNIADYFFSPAEVYKPQESGN